MKLTTVLLLVGGALAGSLSDPLEKHTIKADGIEASFIGYGARLTNLYVNDKDCKKRDIALGYDEGQHYVQDTATEHTNYGAVVGRYANRIKNSTFTIDGNKYTVEANEHDGKNTLHGGKVGYDQRNWTVSALNDTTITFMLEDDGFEGFPGKVVTYATYTVEGADANPFGNPTLTTSLVSVSLEQRTPIMLSNHIYWNLNGFEAEDGTVLEDTFHLPYASRYVKTDSILIPTGEIGMVKDTPTLDFTKAKTIGKDIKEAKGLCGDGCTGYDNAFINDVADKYATSLSLSSKTSGIRMDIKTNQAGYQIYTCDNMNSTIPIKKDQLYGRDEFKVPQYGCIVIEPQDWIDGINHPEWGRSEYQIFGPESGPSVNYARYEFSTL
ncbi:hypothetical protein TRICI_001724 [Trichomonascus ciferrii]|uniref:Aldose 1-epimerase n=1 Tax=Trichomonascus ciferrii TaxID=44093 RepID=A0A642V7R5_9ASCO|nr:hypothetical protein TRICI_001724 [Trichomonascus ciferrii]